MSAPAAGPDERSGEDAETTIRSRRVALRALMETGQHLWLGLALVAFSYLFARAEVEPFHTYFYFFAWYPGLLALDGLLVKRVGASLLLHRPLALFSLFCWSVPFWLGYEAINLRLENWYYVGAPDSPLVARLFMIVSFATVLPGIVYFYLLLSPTRWIANLRTPPFRATRRVRYAILGLGIVTSLLPIAFPTHAYALIWIALPLLLEPWNRSPRWPSLLRDLEFGSPRRLVLLLVAGLFTGLYWEWMNVPAAAKWIYTVPFFDRALGTEMPPLGFLGFAPFALSAYSFLRFLEQRGLAVPFETATERAPVLARVRDTTRVFVLPVVVAALSFAVVPALEHETIDSRRGSVQELRTASRRDRAILDLSGIDALAELVRAGETHLGRLEIAQLLVTTPARVEAMVEEATLARLRGIGVENARLLSEVGVENVKALAQREPDELFRELRALGKDAARVKPQRVRAWVRGARAETALADAAK